MDEKGLGEHIKNLKSHLQELTYIQKNQYGPNLGDKEEEWIPNESEQKNIDNWGEPKRWQNLKIITDKKGNKIKTRTIEDGSQLFEYPDGSWGFTQPYVEAFQETKFEEDRYDDDLNEHGELPTVRRSEKDMLRRRPYSPKARFKAGL